MYKFLLGLICFFSITSANLVIESQIGGTDVPANNQIVQFFKITNNGDEILDLQDLTLNYYFYEPQLNISNITCNIHVIYM